MKSPFHSLIPFFTAALLIIVAISSQSASTAVSRGSLNYFSVGLGSSLYSLGGRSNRKHCFHHYSPTVIQSLLTYSLLQEPVYQAIA
jgi:hypothetical protein